MQHNLIMMETGKINGEGGRGSGYSGPVITFIKKGGEISKSKILKRGMANKKYIGNKIGILNG